MGQYFKPMILADRRVKKESGVKAAWNPWTFDNGAKLMEHSYLHNDLVEQVIGYIIENGSQRVVWSGDYADDEKSLGKFIFDRSCDKVRKANRKEISDHQGSYINLYQYVNCVCSKGKFQTAKEYDAEKIQMCHYLVNYDKKLYVDLKKVESGLHPLPLLTAEGCGENGGDYHAVCPDSHLVGSWARDLIGVASSKPNDYKELDVWFNEDRETHNHSKLELIKHEIDTALICETDVYQPLFYLVNYLSVRNRSHMMPNKFLHAMTNHRLLLHCGKKDSQTKRKVSTSRYKLKLLAKEIVPLLDKIQITSNGFF